MSAAADPDPTPAESPAAAAPAPYQDDRAERRRGSRVRAVLPIAVRLVRTGSSDVLTGHTREVSDQGMSLKTIRPLPEGSRFLIYLAPGPPDGGALSLVYQVTRCTPAGETEADGFVVAAALMGPAAAIPQPLPPLTPREILRRLRIDDPPRK